MIKRYRLKKLIVRAIQWQPDPALGEGEVDQYGVHYSAPERGYYELFIPELRTFREILPGDYIVEDRNGTFRMSPAEFEEQYEEEPEPAATVQRAQEIVIPDGTYVPPPGSEQP